MPGGLAGVIEYATDLFDSSTVERLAEAYRSVLAAMTANPDQTLRALAPVDGGRKPAVHAGTSWAAAEGIDQRASSPQLAVRQAAYANTGLQATSTQSLLQAIWRDVLEIDAVSPDISFFDLGGTSLGLMRVQARLKRALGREVPIVALFASPTIRRLAAWLDGAKDGAESTPVANRPRLVRPSRQPRARPLG